jgi:hypothetical protein
MFGFKKKESKRPMTLMSTLGIFYHSGTYPNIPPVICVDGSEFGLSYDLAGKRDTNTLEIIYTIPDEPLLKPYLGQNGTYEYVPLSLVRHIIEDIHGGVIAWKHVKGVDEDNKQLNKCVPSRSMILPYKIDASR